MYDPRRSAPVVAPSLRGLLHIRRQRSSVVSLANDPAPWHASPMTRKLTAVGGFDGDDWLTLLALLAAAGVMPKPWRPAIGTAGTALMLYRIAKRLGWL